MPVNMEYSQNTTMEEKCKPAQFHHFPENQRDYSCKEPNGEFLRLQQLTEGDQTGMFLGPDRGSPLDDGYTWRKYGQKQVKGSKCPRSYYRCTHPSCQVRRKVEHSLDGQVTEIVYMGGHHHPKPHPFHQPVFGPLYKLRDNSDKKSEVTVDRSEDLKPNFQDMRSSASGVDNPHSQANFSSSFAGDSQFSSLVSKNEEDAATEGAMFLGDVNECDPKKRKRENSFREKTQERNSVHQSKVVVQTVSEVDVLEDGYRWRKYGQKVVKKNPNPRSYYKCTTPGCSVRKHIERAAEDARSVITSYEGKHTHEVPGTKGNNHIFSSGISPNLELNYQSPFTLSQSSPFRPEPRVLVPSLHNLEIDGECMKTSSFRNFTDSEALNLHLYQTILRTTAPLPLDTFGMSSSIYRETQQVLSGENIAPESHITFSPAFAHSNSGMACCNLSVLGSVTPEFQSTGGEEPKMNFTRILTNPEKKAHAYDSPDTILYCEQFSPSLSSISDGPL